MAGLTLLATPLGDPGDLSANARRALADSRSFLAEDAGRLARLLSHLGVDPATKRIRPFHDHNQGGLEAHVRWIRESGGAVLVSDAGSPVLSDPGYPLVAACRRRGVPVRTLPGPSAVVAALELSGLPPAPFHFHGFLPRGAGPVRRAVEATLGQRGTHVLFESPRRVAATVDEIASHPEVGGVVLAREITKTHEEVLAFDRSEWPSVRGSLAGKGEHTVLYHVPEAAGALPPRLVRAAEECLAAPSPRRLAKLLAAVLGGDPKDLYRRLGG